MNIKATLEKKLGRLSDAEVNFAIEQFEKNIENIKLNRKVHSGRRMYTDEAFNEISSSIDFYNNHCRR